MKENSSKYSLLFVALVVKFGVSLLLTTPVNALLYTAFIAIFVYLLTKYTTKLYNYALLISADFLIGFLILGNSIGMNASGLFLSVFYFLASGAFFYYLLVDYVAQQTATRVLRNISDVEVDKGIKALENDNYELAIDYFTQAIKENKTNYLGYMGMYNTLNKFDKKNIRKIKYYKKQCLKYAPRELKESVKGQL